MGAIEVVLDEPVRQFLVEGCRILIHVSAGNELFLERTIESFAHCVVLGRLRSTPPMGELQFSDGLFEVLVEFAAVVGLDVDQLPTHELVKSAQEIGSG